MKKPAKATAKAVAIYVELDPAIHRILAAIKQRDGIPYRFQLEQAVRLWAAAKGVAA